MDPDLKEYQRRNALSALSNRSTDKGLESINRPSIRKRKQNPLFEMNDSDLSEDERLQLTIEEEEDDEALAFAIQASLDHGKRLAGFNGAVASSSRVTLDSPLFGPQTPTRRSSSPFAASDDFDDVHVAPNRLSTALKFAHSHSEHSARKVSDGSPSGMFDMTSLLTPPKLQTAAKAISVHGESDEDADMEAIEISIPVEVAKGLSAGSGLADNRVAVRPVNNAQSTLQPSSTANQATIELNDSLNSFVSSGLLAARTTRLLPASMSRSNRVVVQDDSSHTVSTSVASEVDDSDSDMEEVAVDTIPDTAKAISVVDDSDSEMEEVQVEAPSVVSTAVLQCSPTPPARKSPVEEPRRPSPPPPEPAPAHSTLPSPSQFQLDADSSLFVPNGDSRTPSPQPPAPAPYSPPLPPPHGGDYGQDLEHQNQEHENRDEREWHEQEFDAADEMDPHAEEGQFAEFLSQVKGRDLHDVRKEIDDEIVVLNQQRKAALRDAEDVTQQMVNQIMVGLLSLQYFREYSKAA